MIKESNMTKKTVTAVLMMFLLGCDSSVDNSDDGSGGLRNKLVIEDSVFISIEMFNTQFKHPQTYRGFTILDAGKPFEKKFINSGVNCIEGVGCFAAISEPPSEFEAYYRSSGKRSICFDTRSNDIPTLENRMYEYDLYSGEAFAGHYICGLISQPNALEAISNSQISYYTGKGFGLDGGGFMGTLTIYYK